MKYIPITLFLFPICLLAQISIGGKPLSFYPEFQKAHGETVLEVATIEIPTHKEEADPRLVALPISVDFDMETDGTWTDMHNGDRLWRLHIQVKGASSLSVLYDDFFLPKGAKFYAYSSDQKQILGAYTRRNNNKVSTFITGEIQGENMVLEYYEPAAVYGQGRIHIHRVDYARLMNEVGFGSAAGCHININCPEGDDYQTERTSVCRMRMVFEEGQALCTGTLMNNSAQDGTPYLLTAFHCEFELNPIYQLWRFDLYYEGESCENPSSEPRFLSMLGCSKRSAWAETDFMLLELSRAVPESYNVHLQGWNRSFGTASSAVHIHHPRSDIKKISVDPVGSEIHPQTIAWNFDLDEEVDYTSPEDHHFINVFRQNQGTFEQGSSGSALMDENKRIVGILSGGFEDTLCQNTTAYFGRLALSWEGGGSAETRLRDWLDPMGTGSETLDAIQNPNTDDFVLMQGRITTREDEGIADVALVVLENDQTTSTDIAGNYFLDDLVFGQNYVVGPVKDNNHSNGVTTFDLVRMRQHILNSSPFSSPYELIAADVNDSNSVSTFDIVQCQKLILNIDQVFANTTSWRFVTASSGIGTVPLADYDFSVPNAVQVTGITSDLEANFIGIKIGDIDDSANPQN